MSVDDRPDDVGQPATLAVLEGAIASDVARLHEHEPLVREGSDPEAVHQARVACRRLRSQLRTFAVALRSGETGPVVTELRWLGRLLGSVRDLDVLGERLAGDLAGTDEGGRRIVMQRCAMDRQEAFTDLIVAMRGRRYRGLLEELDSLAAGPPVKRSYAGRPAEAVLLPEVRRRWQELDAAVSTLHEPPRDADLHHVRILSKRGRYAAEIATPFGPGDIAKLAKRLAKIQKVLGELNDSSRAVEWLGHLKMAPWPRTSPAPAGSDPLVAVELALAVEHQALAERRTEWRDAVDSSRDSARALGWPAAARGDASPPGEDVPPAAGPGSRDRPPATSGRLRAVGVKQ